MLAQQHRLTGAPLFTSTVRTGARKGSTTLVGHLRLPAAPGEATADDGALSTPASGPARVGLVVSRAVGNAVIRNRTKRRLRHLVAERLALLPAGSTLVVRALPAAASADYARLGEDLDHVLRRLVSSRATDEAAQAGSSS